MRTLSLFPPIRRRLAVVLYLVLLLAACLLLWVVRDLPLQLTRSDLVRLDSLSAFFLLLTLCIAGVELMRPPPSPSSPLTVVGITLASIVAYSTSHLLLVALAYLLATGGRIFGLWATLPPIPSRRSPATGTSLAVLVRRMKTPAYDLLAMRSTWLLLPCLALWLAYGAQSLNAGTWRYTDPAAGGALTSFVFWFVLLATLLGSNVRLQTRGIVLSSIPSASLRPSLLLSVAWMYPLMRTFSMGGWNTGWHSATVLLGMAVMGWAAWQGRRGFSRDDGSLGWVQGYLGLALVGIGIGTGLGLVAACYGLLVAALVILGSDAPDRAGPTRWRWLLSGAVPLTAPFVAAWLSIAAATAADRLLLAVAVWSVLLLVALATIRSSVIADRAPSQFRLAAILSVVAGIAAPWIVRQVLHPIAQQLQPGLRTPSDMVLWPWSNLLVTASLRQPVALLPSLTVGALVVLSSVLAWLLLRLEVTAKDRR